MRFESVYVLQSGDFAKFLVDWFGSLGVEVHQVDLKTDLSESIQGVVLLHENHNLFKELEDIAIQLDKSNVPSYKIDINGTLAATRSNFEMWVERNRPKNILFIGRDELAKNDNLGRFFQSLPILH
jgi:hypothetical protein